MNLGLVVLRVLILNCFGGVGRLYVIYGTGDRRTLFHYFNENTNYVDEAANTGRNEIFVFMHPTFPLRSSVDRAIFL